MNIATVVSMAQSDTAHGEIDKEWGWEISPKCRAAIHLVLQVAYK